MDLLNLLQSRITASVQLKQSLLSNEALLNAVTQVATLAADAYRNGNKVMWCGNGGSAADAQHLAAELSGRFYYDRPPLNSDALHVNTSYMTAVANDYSYEQVYSRLVQAMCQKGDILIGLSTSGNSGNVVKAFEKAREMGVTTVGFTGETGGKMKPLSDFLINIPSTDTPRIQECHMLLGHTLCEIVEQQLFPKA
ncbi:MAG: D-sedoheptulose 7-phosphate isomerase [Bacteroidia bacterium]|jgi:D-sedoheptulose 7-phosphate isomerase|nr:D-sedoheptulose 7-phosphate isomerase [Bacteroidia bacterium]